MIVDCPGNDCERCRNKINWRRKCAALFGRELSLARNLGSAAAHAEREGFACAFPPPTIVRAATHQRRFGARVHYGTAHARKQVYTNAHAKIERKPNDDSRIAC
jgi:hypothetical protein